MHYVLAFVTLQITFSILMYIICVKFVQCFELQGKEGIKNAFYRTKEDSVQLFIKMLSAKQQANMLHKKQ